MNLILPGFLIGLGGFVAGKTISDHNQKIRETLKPLEEAIDDFEFLFEDYKQTYNALQMIYQAYSDGAEVNWDDATALEQALKTKELALDNQVSFITSIIEEVEYGI